MELHPREVEAQLTSYYDAEADDRARRQLTPERVEARRRFVADIDPTGPPVLVVQRWEPGRAAISRDSPSAISRSSA